MKKVTPLMAALAFSAASAASFPLTVTEYPNTSSERTTTLNSCVRQGQDILCTGTVTRPQDGWSDVEKSDFLLISPTGQEARPSEIMQAGGDSPSTTIRAGIQYPVSVKFRNFPGNPLYFDMMGKRFEGVTFGGSMPTPARVTTQPVTIQNKTYKLSVDQCQSAGNSGAFTCRATFTPGN